LLGPTRTAFCRIEVLRDGRLFRDDDVRAMVGSAKELYRVGAEAPDAIDSGLGRLTGITSDDADLAASPIARSAGRGPRFGVWAGRRELRLVTALAGTSELDPDPGRAMRDCRGAIASMRLP
jgi:hypothetical protein